MTAIPFALIGCGGMGRRHLHGLAELDSACQRAGIASLLSLVAVVDVSPARANALADDAERTLGQRPIVFNDLTALQGSGACLAVDINTATESHASLGIQALDGGLHVLVEKPLSADIHTASRMVACAARNARVLAVAENLRRDPVNRFAHALIRSGAIGDVRFYADLMFTGWDAIWLTPWRHMRHTGGMLLDVGVHAADILEYLAGPVHSVIGRVHQDEPVRRRTHHSPVGSAAMYQSWASELPAQVQGDAEDVAVGLLQLASGASAQWTLHLAAHGRPRNMRTVFGSCGSIDLPPDRSGQPPTVNIRGKTLSPADALALLPGYCLPGLEAVIWGDSHISHFAGDFASIDRKLVAVELADFALAISQKQAPEVDGAHARRNMALTYALAESSIAQRSVTVAEVESGALHAYQDLFKEAA